MSKNEEKLRRAVLSRESAAPRVPSRVAGILAAAGVLAMGDAQRPVRVDHNAERGRFSSGDHHPDKCSCAKCADWRKAERYR